MQLGVHVGDAELGHGVLTGTPAQQVDLGPAALVGLLDPLRVDAPVGDEALQREPGHFPSHRVEAGQQDRLWRVVDDQVDAGDGLEGADVAPLAADDPALHLVARQMQDGDDRLAGLLGRYPLDGQRHDLAGALVAFLPRRALDVPDGHRGLALGLALDGRDELRTWPAARSARRFAPVPAGRPRLARRVPPACGRARACAGPRPRTCLRRAAARRRGAAPAPPSRASRRSRLARSSRSSSLTDRISSSTSLRPSCAAACCSRSADCCSRNADCCSRSADCCSISAC